MKVAFLTTDSREHYKDYACPEPYFGTAPEALLQGFARLPELEVHVICCVQQPVRSPEKIAPNIFYHSLVVPKFGWMRTLYQGCIRAVRKKLREIQPDIVHGQGTERDCAISAVLSGFPNIVTIHGNMNAIAQLHQSRFGSFHWLAARLENYTLARTGGIICISDYVKNLVEKYGVKTWLVPNAIQKMFFDFPRTLQTADVSGQKPLLINVGVVSRRKRQQELLTVLEALRAEGLQFESLFVGVVNPQDAYAFQFVTSLQQADQKFGDFKHIQKLDDAAFCRLYDRAAAMIHFSSEESFGLTFAEAIARGIYLFASDVGAIRDIANGIARAQIFNLDDWDGMKSSLRRWLAAEEYKRPRLSSPPQEFVQRYHPVFVAQKHLEIYREVLRGR